MNVVIHQSWIIFMFVLFSGVTTISVVIEGSKGGFLGENGTEIECLYTQEDISYVSFLAFNKSSITLEVIATYRPSTIPQLTPQGQYLEGRVTLTPIKQLSTKAVMTFNQLMCIDDTSYKCQVNYFDSRNLPKQTVSNNILSISVQVPPSKPDSVSLVHTPADSSVTTTKHMDYSTSLPSTAVTTNEYNTVSASKMKNQNTTTAFNHSTIQTTGLDTTTSTPSPDNVSSNVGYKTTTYSKKQTTTEQVIAEGDTITVVCTGHVGNPPAEHFFQKNRYGQTKPVNYTASATSKIENSDNCSYYRTSYLTFQVKAEDNNAVIRCVVNSSMAWTDMFVEMAPIEVYYQVSMPTIILYQNKTDYVVGLDSSIHFICKSDGNPRPNFHWYIENNNEPISESENFTITHMNKTGSGMYTCNVSNSFNGNTYKNAANVTINIMNIADISTTQSSSTGNSSGADGRKENSTGKKVITGVVVVLGISVIIGIIVFGVYKWTKRIDKPYTDNFEYKSFIGSKSKSIAESGTGNFDFIDLEDANKTQSVDNRFEAEDIREHNKEYLKKQENEEQKKNKSNGPTQLAVYAQVNEATKSRNKQITETPECADKQEEDTYAETQEGIYDKAGDRRHKENENVEHFDTSNNSSKQNSNGDTKLSIQTSQIGSFVNKAFEKDESCKVATVSPTVHSSGSSQDDKQTKQSRNSQSKIGYENIKGTDETGTSGEDSSHQTAW